MNRGRYFEAILLISPQRTVNCYSLLAVKTYDAVLKVQEQLWGVATQLQQLQELIVAEFAQISFEIQQTRCSVAYGESSKK